MAKKKPVWVEEDVHAMFKRYAKLLGASMTDVASRVVLEKLDALDGDEQAPAPKVAKASESKAEEASEDEVVIKTADAPPKTDAPEAATPEPVSQAGELPEEKKGETRFLGGIWLV